MNAWSYMGLDDFAAADFVFFGAPAKLRGLLIKFFTVALNMCVSGWGKNVIYGNTANFNL